jgi:hypothetical protein
MTDRVSAYRSTPTPPEIHPADSVEDPDLRYLLDYWNRLRGMRTMPARAEIEPKEIRRSLRYVHMYDVVEGGQEFRARLVGTAVYPGLDHDQTGKLISEHPDPGVRLRFAVLLRHVVTHRAPARSVSLRQTASAITDRRTEGLWLPLGEGDAVEQILVQSSLRPLGYPGAEPGTNRIF